jgi:16S rRNA G966 N2-methylase RsmD
LSDAVFLDLFAGTGSVALEALRRGTGYALCVESDRATANAISSRFIDAGYDLETAKCLISDVRRALPKLARESADKPFGVIFADPPYCMGWGAALPPIIAENWSLLSPGGVFVFEHSSRETLADIFIPRDDRIYGETVMSFYWNQEEIKL